MTPAIENLWGIVKRKMRNKRPKNADELKATVKETWASIPPQQCHKLIPSMSAVSKHVNRKLSGRKKCGRKSCTTNRENRSLMRIVKQNRFKNLGELHKEWTEAGVKASRATTHRRVKEFGYSCRIPLVKPLLNHRQRQRRLTWAKEKKNWTVAQWSKVLFSDVSKFCISFGNQGPRVWRKGGEAHSPSCMKSSVKFPQSVMIWGAMSSAGVGPLCF